MATLPVSPNKAGQNAGGNLQRALGYRSPFKFLRDLRADPLGFFAMLRDHADVASFSWRGGAGIIYLFHPDGARHVLQENHRNYQKEAGSAPIFRTLLGDGIFLSDGERWRSARRTAQPAFHKKQIDGLAELMTNAIGEMIERWDRAARSDATLDVGRESIRLAIAVASRSLFSTDLTSHEETLRAAMAQSFAYINHQLYHPLSRLPLSVPTPRNLRMRRTLRQLDRIAYGILDDHRKNERRDLISMMLAGEAGNDRKLMRDEIVTFLGAGSETTAVTIAWAIYLLARNPEARERMREEALGVLAGRVPTSADVRALHYTRMVIMETLRLYPPAFVVSRTAIDADEIGGCQVPAGASLMICTHTIQHDPRFWSDPESFDPERFSPPRAEGRLDYAFFPFGGGPRQCIGEEFAMMEATLALAMIAQRFHYQLSSGVEVRPNPVFTLRPDPPISLKLRRI